MTVVYRTNGDDRMKREPWENVRCEPVDLKIYARILNEAKSRPLIRKELWTGTHLNIG